LELVKQKFELAGIIMMSGMNVAELKNVSVTARKSVALIAGVEIAMIDNKELKNLIELQRILLSISSKLNVLDNEFNAIEWKE